MKDTQSKDPLHGITLEMLLNELVEFYGWGMSWDGELTYVASPMTPAFPRASSFSAAPRGRGSVWKRYISIRRSMAKNQAPLE